MPHITSCLVVLALGLALVQAAPKKLEKKSISDALAPKAIKQVNQNLDTSEKLGDEALMEAADGQNVYRAKKQALMTFCVEIRQTKLTQVDCSELTNQPSSPPLQPQSVPPPAQPDHFPPAEIKVDITAPSVPMGPPCEPDIARFITPRGDIPSTFQTPDYGPSLMPSGPGGEDQVINIPGGFPHRGFPGNYPSTGLPDGYPAGMISNSEAGFPGIHISSGPDGLGGFPMSGLPNGGLPNSGAGVPTINIVPGTGMPGGFSNGDYISGGYSDGGYPSGVSPINVLHLPGGGLPSGPPIGGSDLPTTYINHGSKFIPIVDPSCAKLGLCEFAENYPYEYVEAKLKGIYYTSYNL